MAGLNIFSALGGRFRNFFRSNSQGSTGKNPTFFPLHMSLMNNSKTPIWIDIDNLLAVYLLCPPLRAVIDEKAQMFKNADIHVVDKDGNKKENHPVLKLLKKPTPMQWTDDWLAQLSVMTDIYGSAFIYKLRATSISLPKCLWVLPSGDMKIIPTGKMFKQSKIEEIIEKYVLNFGDVEEVYKTLDIIQINQSGATSVIKPDSKISSLQKAITNVEGAYKTRNILLFEKGAIGILSSDTRDGDGGVPLGVKEQIRLGKQFTDKMGIYDEQGRIIMSSAALKWNPMSYPTKDLLLFEEGEAGLQDFCQQFGMKRDIFPSTKGATFENANQAIKQTYQNTIQPFADAVARTLTEQLGLEAEGLELVFDYSWLPVMQEDQQKEQSAQKTKAEMLAILRFQGIISREAYAEAMGVELTGEEVKQGGDSLGKVPLAVQQLALARERAITAGDSVLAQQLGDKMDELLQQI